jgi:hypothetical protein
MRGVASSSPLALALLLALALFQVSGCSGSSSTNDGTGGATGGGPGGAAGNVAGGASGGSGGAGGGASGGAGSNQGFSCGSETCVSGESFCFTKYPPLPGTTQQFGCRAPPTACSSMSTSCACVCGAVGDCRGIGSGAPCQCTDTGGEVRVTCLLE